MKWYYRLSFTMLIVVILLISAGLYSDYIDCKDLQEKYPQYIIQNKIKATSCMCTIVMNDNSTRCTSDVNLKQYDALEPLLRSNQ